MNYKGRLKEYLEVDTLYQNYKKGIEEEKSDFDLFCVQHCLDIENLLNEVEELHNKIDKAIEYINDNIVVYAFNNEDLPHWEFNDDEIKILLEILKENE